MAFLRCDPLRVLCSNPCGIFHNDMLYRCSGGTTTSRSVFAEMKQRRAIGNLDSADPQTKRCVFNGNAKLSLRMLLCHIARKTEIPNSGTCHLPKQQLEYSALPWFITAISLCACHPWLSLLCPLSTISLPCPVLSPVPCPLVSPVPSCPLSPVPSCPLSPVPSCPLSPGVPCPLSSRSFASCSLL